MNVGHVQGGTNAGWRKIKQPEPWTHLCVASTWTPHETRLSRAGATFGTLDVHVDGARTLTSYSCPDCGARRPA